MATIRDNFQVKVSNYLVPATGGTAAVSVQYAGEGTVNEPVTIAWKDYSLDGEPFNPSGFYAANFSLDSIFLKISGNDLTIEIPPSGQMGRMYPAPFDHTVYIYGTGDGEIIFVNSPVIPYGPDSGGGGGAVTIADGADVAEGTTTDIALDNPANAGTVISILKSIQTLAAGFDTDGLILPLDFGSLPQSFTYSAGILQTEVRTNLSGSTWTRTYTYTGADLTGISGWVRVNP